MWDLAGTVALGTVSSFSNKGIKITTNTGSCRKSPDSHIYRSNRLRALLSHSQHLIFCQFFLLFLFHFGRIMWLSVKESPSSVPGQGVSWGNEMGELEEKSWHFAPGCELGKFCSQEWHCQSRLAQNVLAPCLFHSFSLFFLLNAKFMQLGQKDAIILGRADSMKNHRKAIPPHITARSVFFIPAKVAPKSMSVDVNSGIC